MLTKDTWYEVLNEIRKYAMTDMELTHINLEIKIRSNSFGHKNISTVKINLVNVDYMQHNLLILKPGSKDKVGAAADKLAAEPNGAELNYIPKVPEVLFSTPLVNPQKTYSMTIKIPETVGEYPYICSFPGHWRIMNGVMKVIAK